MMFLPVLEEKAGDAIISIKNYWKQGIACLEKQNHVNPSLPVFLVVTQIASVAFYPTYFEHCKIKIQVLTAFREANDRTKLK